MAWGRSSRVTGVVAAIALLPGIAWAQHEGHGGRPSGVGLSHGEQRADPTGVLMRRMRLQGSGTSLQPASSPMWARHGMSGDWAWSWHGNALGSWNGATGPRGYGEASLTNWGMAMGSRMWGPGILQLKAMASLDFLTTPPGGTPQLFQTGETYGGRPLIDRQHPHELFMELAARYDLAVSDRLSLFAYGGPVGEPALGPNTYMHRVSAADNGIAPLAHHLQDSTHIVMGVVTAGAQLDRWQLEGSIFRGREPDERRWAIELGALDSYSARLSYAPSADWVLQVSSGYLTQPETLVAGDAVRSTASLHYNRPFGWGNWATSLVWGQNREFAHAPPLLSNGYLLESAVEIDRDQVYGRFEAVDKIGLLQNLPGQEHDESRHRIHALTIGAARGFGLGGLDLALGGDLTLHAQPAPLVSYYGASPVAYRVYVRLRPPRSAMHP